MYLNGTIKLRSGLKKGLDTLKWHTRNWEADLPPLLETSASQCSIELEGSNINSKHHLKTAEWDKLNNNKRTF